MESIWQIPFVSTIAMELDQLLNRLDTRTAESLERRVREAMSRVANRDGETPTLEEMKRRRPEFAGLIGSLADVEFDLPADLLLPPAKTW